MTAREEEFSKTIDELAAQLWQAHLNAAKGSTDWHRHKDRLKAYMKRNRYTEDQARKKLGIQWELVDSMDYYKWWAGEQQRIGSLINTLLAVWRFDHHE